MAIDKLDQMMYITYGYIGLWIVGGTLLSFYVRAQTSDVASKGQYCT